MNNDIPRTTGRVIWIDIMRGIAILLMILCHLSMYGSFPYSLQKLIYVFHVPVFFFVTGCVEHFDLPMGKFAGKKAKTLLVPYFILFFLSRHLFIWDHWENLPDIFFRVITGLNVGPLWFLPTLFFTELLFRAIYDRSEKNFFCRVVILSIIGIAINRFALPVCRFHHEFINFFWHLDVVPIVLFFMYLGHVVFKNGILSKIAQTPKYFYGAAFLCLLITAASGKFNDFVDIHVGKYGFIPCFYIGACAGIFLTAFFSLFLESHKVGILSKLLVLAGKNSMVLLAFHWLFGDWASELLHQAEKFCQFEINGYIRVYAVFLASILMTVPVTYIINRYCPFIIGRHKATAKSLPLQS